VQLLLFVLKERDVIRFFCFITSMMLKK